MSTRFAILVAGLLFFSSALPAQNVLNRVVCTKSSLQGGAWVVFADADATGPSGLTSYPLPVGFVPGSLVAMDRNGDVWLNESLTTNLIKVSATGQVLAMITHPAAPTYLTTDRQANLIVGSYDQVAPPSGSPSVYLHMYSPTGQLLRSLDVASLFPPGVFVPFAGQVGFFLGIPRILVTSSGALWFIVFYAGHDPVIRLNPDWTLAGSWGVFLPTVVLPDNAEGVWVAFDNSALYSFPTYFPGIPMPGLPVYGWVHLSATGTVLQTSGDPAVSGYYVGPLWGQARPDGRHFQYPSGTIWPSGIWVHLPQTTTGPWYTPSAAVPLPTSPSFTYYLSGFHFDGNQKLWALRNNQPSPGPPGLASSLRWHVMPREAPYTNYLELWVGFAFLQNLVNYSSWFWTSFWGPATLYEYAFYTDPLGDLDGDGVPNGEELVNLTNPFVPSSQTVQALPSPAGPGSWFHVTYTVPGDGGLPYFAPFALGAASTPLGGGYTVPFAPVDLLVQESLQPTFPWMSNTVGVLDAMGQAQAGILVPSLPWLSGFQFTCSILTADPALPTLFKTISPSYALTVP